MSYQVLARKWRPQRFDAVVGQDAITRTLRNALTSGRVAHAYLFAGPRGIGKTTTARLLARALLCPRRTEPEPCGACDVCQDANAVDVIEIDGASNRGIEEIRTLRENVKYAPARGRYKVYIIDEVHQLTEAAFNALLKTLEEPPGHVVFILATTDPRDIPATVLSRVQRFDFRPIAPDALARSLERILTEEAIPFDASALPVIVRAAEGSLRDALSLLDTAVAYGNGRLDAESAATLLGATAPAEVRAFATALVRQDTTAALEAVDRAAREGEDLHAFVRDVIELLRLALVLKAAPTAKLADLTPTEGNELRALGESASLDEILYVVRAFLDADEMMRESPHPRVELEVAAVRATRRPVPQAIEEILRRVDEAESRLRQQAIAAPGVERAAAQETFLIPGSEAPARPSSAPPSRRSAGSGWTPPPPPPAQPPRAAASTEIRGAEPRGAESRTAVAEPAPADLDAGPASSELGTGWARVLDEVTRKKPMLSAVLAQARPVAVSDGVLTLALAGNHFHREMLNDRVARDVITQAVRRHLADVDRFEIAGEGETIPGPTSHPAVQAAIAEFQGEVVAVRARSPEGDVP